MKYLPNEVVDFYTSLEEINSIDIWEIQQSIKYTEPVEGKIREDIITERKAFNLNFNNGVLTSNIQLADISGGVNNSLHFSKNEIEYLESRLLSTSNLFLRGRYANILWQETKNNKYATLTIDSYVDLIKTTDTDDLQNTLEFLHAIIYISKTTKQKLDYVKLFIKKYIETTERWFKIHVFSIVLDRNFFSNEDLLEISDTILTWVDNENYFLNIDILEKALKLFKKLKKSDKEIYGLFAENEDIIISKHSEDSFISVTSVGKKAHYLKKAHRDSEYESLMIEYNKLKQKTKLNKIATELNSDDTEKINEYFNKKAKLLLKLPPESILGFFACDESILVDPERNKEMATKRSKESLKNLFSVTLLDINNNAKQLSDIEKIEQDIFNSYSVTHNLLFYVLFVKVFIDGAIQGKSNYYSIFEYFKKYTWYGQKFNMSVKDDYEDDASTWLSMIAPGLHNLFSQFELSALLNTNKINNYILAIDSLTLKFEGALRDFIRLTGGNTTVEKNNLMQEQLLEHLLDNPKAKEFFSERDIALFKYTFTKEGLNVRNNVAHCFFRYTDYSLQSAALIFLCLIRLGQFELTQK